MDRADALARLQDAAVAPGRLAMLLTDGSPDAVALRELLEHDADLVRELDALELLNAALALAAPDDVAAPAGARERVIGAVLAKGQARGAGSAMADSELHTRDAELHAGRVDAPAGPEHASGGAVSPLGRRRGAIGVPGRIGPGEPGRDGAGFRWLALGAAAAVALFVAGALLGGPLGLTPTPSASPDPDSILARVLGATAEIVAGPGHLVAALETPSGEPAGAVVLSPSSGRLVVVTTALAAPPEGAVYECYIERDGRLTEVGPMHFQGDTGYWAGPVDAPIDPGTQGDRFLVILEGETEPALTGDF